MGKITVDTAYKVSEETRIVEPAEATQAWQIANRIYELLASVGHAKNVQIIKVSWGTEGRMSVYTDFQIVFRLPLLETISFPPERAPFVLVGRWEKPSVALVSPCHRIRIFSDKIELGMFSFVLLNADTDTVAKVLIRAIWIRMLWHFHCLEQEMDIVRNLRLRFDPEVGSLEFKPSFQPMDFALIQGRGSLKA